MTTKLQNAIIISSIIGTIMSEYDPRNPKENTKSINIIKARIKKFMFSRSRKNPTDFAKSVMFANVVWREAVEHFAQKKMTIEAVSTILGLYNLYEEELSKFANLNQKQMENFSMNQSDTTILAYEKNSCEVSNYIIDALAPFTRKERRKLNLLEKIKQNKE